MNLKLSKQYYDSKEFLKKLQERAEYLSFLEENEFEREGAIEKLANDPILFIEMFGWTRLTELNETVPFFLWEYQKDIILKLKEAEGDVEKEHEILIDKPRDMGVTWVITWYMLWRWLFKKGWSGFVLSRTEVEVDSGNDDPSSSIFGKLRWCIKLIPYWLQPAGWRPKTGTRGTSTDMNLRLVNPDNESVIVGSTTNSGAGRSRRYSMSFIDEAFAIESFNNVYRALQTVSRVKLFASTVRVGSVFKKFKDLCEGNGDYISLRWQQHPWKDAEWFAEMEKKAEVDPEVMKELSVDYNVNVRAQYYPEIAKSKVIPIEYDPTLPVYVSLDTGSKDLTVIIWVQFDGKEIKVVECYSARRRDLNWYVPFLNPHLIAEKKYELVDAAYSAFQKELLGKLIGWRKPTAYFGEAAHFQKNMPSNRSIADELVRFGIRLLYNNYAIKHEPRRNAVSLLLPRTVFNQNSEYVTELYDALASSRFNTSMKSVSSKDSLMKPVHDEGIADYRSAFENFAVNASRVFKNQRKDLELINGQVESTISNLVRYLKI